MKPETIVLIEHDRGNVRTSSLSAITFARQLGNGFSLLVIGHDVGAVAQSATTFGAATVFIANHELLEYPVADRYASVIAAICKSHGFSNVVASSSTFSRDVLPRVAALLDAGMLTDVIAMEEQSGARIFRRPMYAGNSFATVRLDGDIRVMSVRATAFDPATKWDTESSIESITVNPDSLPNAIEFVSREERVSERPDLTEARVVVSGGRPLKDTETFNQLIGELADVLGGAIGATRAAVDLGIVPNDWQVGQTGKVVAPELYIAVGVSGAIQHLAGMKDSKIIVAINKDPDAPIFQIATYGLVGDLFQIVPQLTEALRSL